MNTVRIENWFISTDNPYAAPEVAKRVICGEVFDHPKFPNGSKVTSSSLTEINLVEGYVNSHNTHFELGAIQKEYFDFVMTLPKPYEGIEKYNK